MDAQTVSVLLWAAMGGGGFVMGLVGLAATKRSMQESAAREALPERQPVGAR